MKTAALAGQFVMARLHLSTLHDVLTIPRCPPERTGWQLYFSCQKRRRGRDPQAQARPVNAETAVVEAASKMAISS